MRNTNFLSNRSRRSVDVSSAAKQKESRGGPSTRRTTPDVQEMTWQQRRKWDINQPEESLAMLRVPSELAKRNAEFGPQERSDSLKVTLRVDSMTGAFGHARWAFALLCWSLWS